MALWRSVFSGALLLASSVSETPIDLCEICRGDNDPCTECEEGMGCIVRDCVPLGCTDPWCQQCPEGEVPTLIEGACCETCMPNTNAVVSVSTCDDLGWTNTERRGSTSVCGESKNGLGGCSGELGWAEAAAFCADAGARLCSAVELQEDEAKGTGCKCDRKMIWTHEACPGGYTAAPGSSRMKGDSSCVAGDNTDTINARCCADV